MKLNIDLLISRFLDLLALILDAVNKAFQFTSISSVTLLDCCAIPCAIVFTWVFLGTRYSVWQLFGASLCVLGLGLMLLSDAEMAGGGDIFFSTSSNQVIFVFSASLLYFNQCLFMNRCITNCWYHLPSFVN